MYWVLGYRVWETFTMKTIVSSLALTATAWALLTGSALAGGVGPAPMMGAGLPGLAVLAVAGVGYVAVRVWRGRKG